MQAARAVLRTEMGPLSTFLLMSVALPLLVVFLLIVAGPARLPSWPYAPEATLPPPARASPPPVATPPKQREGLGEVPETPVAPPEPAGRWMDVRATAYSPLDPQDSDYRRTKGPRWVHITADGETDVRIEPYGIAVPRRTHTGPILPYGTQVYIPTGYGYLDRSRPEARTFTVDDTGAAITRRTRNTGIVYVDLRFRTPESAREWAGPLGYRDIRIFVFE